jgi:uncharacterized protein (TIGR03437 family)
MRKLVQALAIFGAVLYGSSAVAQSPAWDSSGNAMLKGTYSFRQVYYHVGSASGDLTGSYALYGNIVFDGVSQYSLSNATLLTHSQGSSTTAAYSASGTYSIAASGYGFLSGLFCPSGTTCPNNNLYVMVTSGMIVGSSPDGGQNDVFVGAPVPSPLPTNATFQGTWTTAGYIPAIGATAGSSATVFFPMNPDGNGNLGTVTITGYIGSNNGTPTVQVEPNVTYSFTDGVATIKFPGSGSASSFLSGTYNFYFSPDGTFFFGGSLLFPDLLFGVRNPPAGSSLTLSGIYFDAGLDQNDHLLSQGFSDFDTYYGAFNATGGNLIEADRVHDPSKATVISSSFTRTYPATITDGTYTSPGLTHYAFNSSGAIRIGAGIAPYLSLSVGVKAPTLTGSGVYLNPMGVTNAASFAPFTTGISPGEAIVLYGSGLASSTTNATALPLSTTLDNVQVKINGVAAPLYYVMPTQIAAIVPYGLAGSVAQIQVTNSGVASKIVTQFVRTTSPGVYSIPSGGIGAAAVEHADGSLVSAASPAVPGETLQIFAAGLGAVTPSVADGAAVPLSPLSYTNSTIVALFGGAKGTVTFSGLTPTLAGLYQVNATVPAGAPTGAQVIELDGPDSATAEATIPIAAATPSTPANAGSR